MTRSAFLATERTLLPLPRPEDAPLIIPGRSRIWMSAPLRRKIPGTTVRVVKAYAATFDLAFVNRFRIVDLPTLGRPMRTTVRSEERRVGKECRYRRAD